MTYGVCIRLQCFKVIVQAISVAVQDATAEIIGRLKRIVDVWRQRQIFDRDALQSLDTILDEGKGPFSYKEPLF